MINVTEKKLGLKNIQQRPGKTLDVCPIDTYSDEKKLRLALLICQELQKIHENGLVILNLKATNILFDGEKCYLIDCGLATKINEDLYIRLFERPTLGNMMQIMNIYWQIAPECWFLIGKRPKKAAVSMDIYSVGMLLDRMEIEPLKPYLKFFIEKQSANRLPLSLLILLIEIQQNILKLKAHNDNLDTKLINDLIFICLRKYQINRCYKFSSEIDSAIIIRVLISLKTDFTDLNYKNILQFNVIILQLILSDNHSTLFRNLINMLKKLNCEQQLQEISCVSSNRLN